MLNLVCTLSPVKLQNCLNCEAAELCHCTIVKLIKLLECDTDCPSKPVLFSAMAKRKLQLDDLDDIKEPIPHASIHGVIKSPLPKMKKGKKGNY